MAIMTLAAHFDGKHILLDEPCALEPDTRLLVTVLPKSEIGDDADDWFQFSISGLAAAYGEDEAEYPAGLIKEANLEYDGG